MFIFLWRRSNAIDFSDNITSKPSEENIPDKTSNKTYKLKVIELSEEDKNSMKIIYLDEEETGVDPLASIEMSDIKTRFAQARLVTCILSARTHFLLGYMLDQWVVNAH